ncbi:flagellar basal-body rod protein FlgC [Anaerotignum neopropionicum]|uniref:Flagellar basal-body rod protein FlgC n=1 Tax=Anaerotignum neopropionicum TaxID=36847 RepID=A0A136WJ18_9FIRM|nr:flagellar basal body rod protein FlgC [Anaerotignum neopropionicum]KXL54495.1 flagellar basal-body rod protein FlgC [Anaerotignum neopropionicum]
MAFLNAMNISASGLTAQRARLDVISENISNSNITRTESGDPYRRRMVVFEPRTQGSFQEIFNKTAFGGASTQRGVIVSEIVEDESPFKSVYDPTHPDADEDGYVMMPNVDLLKETIDSMEASRAYDANVTAFNAIKAMATKGLEVGR